MKKGMSVEVDMIERCDIVVIKEQMVTFLIVDTDGTRRLFLSEQSHDQPLQ